MRHGACILGIVLLVLYYYYWPSFVHDKDGRLCSVCDGADVTSLLAILCPMPLCFRFSSLVRVSVVWRLDGLWSIFPLFRVWRCLDFQDTSTIHHV